MRVCVWLVVLSSFVGCSSVPKPPSCDGSNLRPINVQQSQAVPKVKKYRGIKGE